MFLSKGRPRVGRPGALCATLFLIAACTQESPTPPAEESSHDHGDSVVVTAFTDEVELFMEYPLLVPGHEARFLAHVTVLETGAPLRSGELRLELSRDGEVVRVLEARKPTRDGLFIPVGTFDEPAEYEARVVVESEEARGTIPLPPLVVHADHVHDLNEDHVHEDAPPEGAVPFLLEQQWKIGLLLEEVEQRNLIERLQVTAEVRAPHHAMAVVGAPLTGRLVPSGSVRLPRLGDRVQRGQVLAYLEPPLTTADRAQLGANRATRDALEIELLLREFDVEAQALEVERVLRQAEARAEFALRSLERLEALRTKDLGTTAELEAARRDLELAREEARSSRVLKGALKDAEERFAELKQRASEARGEDEPDAARRHPLVAPISGEVVEVLAVEGEFVASEEAIYRLLDLERVWVEARVSEFDLAELEDEPGALLRFVAEPERLYDAFDELDGRIVQVGRILDPHTRSLPLVYEIENPGGRLRAGQFADVYLETDRALDTIAIPEEAIVKQGGRPIAFVLLDGETFQKRELELGLRDGRYVEVRAGLSAGERVVTRGAEFLQAAAASPASFGHGHAH